MNDKNIKKYIVKEEKELLDFLITNMNTSRNKAKAYLQYKEVYVNNKVEAKYNYQLKINDVVYISTSKTEKKLDFIIYEDDEFIVINKPSGLLSVATEKEKIKTAYVLVKEYLEAKNEKVFTVHRLDKETSGVLMFSKNSKIKDLLQESWNTLVKSRKYYCVSEGHINKKEDRVINYIKENKTKLMYVTKSDDLDALRCVTNYKVIKENKKYSLLDINLETGRKNQIRVTLTRLNLPLLGDDKYGNASNPIKRLCLHAYELSFIHPITKKEYIFKTKIPKEFELLLK